MPKKLSPAQNDLLNEIAERDQSVVRAYRPAVTLVSKGYAEDLSPDDDHTIKLRITQAGREACTSVPPQP